MARTEVADDVRGVVAETLDTVLVKGLRRVIAQGVHDLFDHCKAFYACQLDGLDVFTVVTVFFIHIGHRIPEGLALLLVECCSLTERGDRGNSVLVTGIGADQAAVALFHAKDILSLSFSLCLQDLAADPLESGQYFLCLYIPACCHCLDQVGGDDGLHNERVLRKHSHGFSLREHILAEQ